MEKLLLFTCFFLLGLAGCTTLEQLKSETRWAINGYETNPYKMGPKKPIKIDTREDELDQYKDIFKFAPVLIQLANDNHKRNFITSFEYDGDQDTSNNWNNLPEGYSLPAILYYSVVETETHYFMTFLSYHVEDRWESSLGSFGNFFLGGSHENDGENIQLVIKKNEDPDENRIVIAALQHHLDHHFYIDPQLGVDLAELNSGGNPYFHYLNNTTLKILDKRPYLFLEAGKHGLGGNYKILKDALLDATGTPGHEIVFWPNNPNKEIPSGEDWQPKIKKYRYGFESIRFALWERYRKGKDIGDEGIMDGGFEVELQRDEQTCLYREIPRFFNSDRMSALFIGKRDAGIMPFYFWEGRLFFDPARNYKNLLKLLNLKQENWSECYIYNPYLPKNFPAVKCFDDNQ